MVTLRWNTGNNRMRKFLGKYWVEIVFGLGFVVGIFLLVGDFSIWVGISTTFQNLLSGLSRFSSGANQAVTTYINSLEITDLVGFVMASVAILILLIRARRRLIQSQRYVGRFCPVCGSAIVRTHRTSGDQMISRILFLSFHRYRCGNQDCTWQGLRKPGRTRSYN